MPKFILGIVLLTLLVTGGATPAFGAYVTDIPFTLSNGLVIVEARIKGDVPVHVVIATGNEYSIIEASLLQKYELPAYYAASGPVTGINDETYSFTKVSRVRIQDSKAKELDMRFGSLAHITQASGREIFAALGADFFADQIVQFDFKNKVLRFLEKSDADSARDKTAASGANKVLLKMAEKERNPFQKTFRVPIVTDVMLDGRKTKVLLDTGRATRLAFSSSAAKKAGFTPPAENGPPREDRVKSLRLGEFEMTDQPVVLLPKGSSAEKSISKYGVVAGSIFLQAFITTFDFRSGLIVLEWS